MNLQTNPDEDPKGISFKSIFKQAHELAEIFLSIGFTDTGCREAKIKKYHILSIANLLRCDDDVVRLYLLNLKETHPRSRGSLLRAAIRMVAAADDLRRGQCPPITSSFTKPHWAGAMVLNAGISYNQERKKNRLNVDFLVISGELAGNIINSQFSAGFAYVLREEIGARLKGRESQLEDADHLSNLIFCYACLFLELRTRPYVERVSATTSMVAYNRKLVRSRYRELSECPFNATFDCVHCSATNHQCNRAVKYD